MMAEAPNPKRRRVDDPLDFIEKPSEDFHCPVTLEILTEPHQTLCCGNHLSQEAADRLKREGKPCPMCKKPNLNTMPDKFFKRMVNQLKVRCSKEASGYNWVGELGNLEKHLSEGSIDGECQFVAVTCPLSCGDHIQRHLLEEHKSTCPHRSCTCKHCGHKATYKSVTEDHWPRCEKYPIPCPNNCGEKAIERLHLKQHLDNTCPLQVIECEFSYAGCENNCQRQRMQGHLEDSAQSHLSMVSGKMSSLQEQNQALAFQLNALTSVLYSTMSQCETLPRLVLPTPPFPVFIPPPDIVMTNFEQHKNDDSWFSPPFYSHIGGYKLCISVDANGWGSGEGTHVSVYIHMMRGEYDDNLKWPFQGKVTVQLLNQRMSNIHTVEQTTTFDNENNAIRVVGRERAEEGWGGALFIAQSDLAYNPARNCQYLMNDCLKFRITKIELATVQ